MPLSPPRKPQETQEGPRTISFTVYGKAQPAGSKRALPAGGRVGGRPIIVDASKGSRAWKQEVAGAALAALDGTSEWDGQPWFDDGPLKAEFIFHVARPQGHYGKKGLRPTAPVWPTTRPDVLKLARAVEDALTGIVWKDDAQIVVETIAKRFDLPIRVDITVSQL